MTSLAGTGALLRFGLRRDRVRLAVWLVLLTLVSAVSASATVALYPSPPARIEAAETANHAQALVALYGRVYDPASLGALAMVKLGGVGAVFVALVAILTTVRHTRAEEESGRQELVGAGIVGRRAPLTSALLLVLGFSLALAACTALGLIAAGLPAAGSVAFGLAWGGVATAFAAITAVVAQLTRSARTATGLAVTVLGLGYVVRAVGDATGPRRLIWLSPIGWGQQIHPYAGDRWWVLLVTLGFTAVAVATAFVLVARRDLGTGVLPERPGPAFAARYLRTPLALAWRLHRGVLLAWVAGFTLLGLVLGNIAAGVQGFLGSPQARDLFTRLGGPSTLVDAYLAAVLGLVGVAASAYGVQAALRLRAEETALHAEALLATAVPRFRWVASHTVIALAGTALLILVAGAAAGLAHAARTGDAAWFGRLLGGAAVHIPAAWVLTGIAVAAVGLTPRAVVVGWAALGGFVLLGEVGPVLRLNHWLMDLSPYTHVPRLLGGSLHVAPLGWSVTLTAVLIAAGTVGMHRRDLA